MGRIIVIIFILAAIPWTIATWWRMRRARSVRERSFIGRSSLGVTLFTVATGVVFALLTVRGQIAALPVVVACGFALRHGMRKARARIREQEGDPVAKAKRVN